MRGESKSETLALMPLRLDFFLNISDEGEFFCIAF